MIKWVSLSEYANFAGVKPNSIIQAIKRHPTKYRIRYRPGVGRGGRTIEIALEGSPLLLTSPSLRTANPPKSPQGEVLPPFSLTATLAEQGPGLENRASAPPADLVNPAELSETALRRYREKLEIINFIKGGEGTVKERISEASLIFRRPQKTIERWRAIYNIEGPVGLVDKYGNRSGDSKVKSDHIQFAIRVYNQRSGPPLTHVYKLLRIKYQATYSYAALKNRMKEMNPEYFADFFRMDRRAWEEKHAYFCRRDFSNLQPNDIICFDSRLWDVFTYPDRHKKKKQKRFWKVAARDLVTGRFTGWSFGTHSSSQVILSALRHSILRCGIPKAIYIDNGLDYTSERVRALVEDVLRIQIVTALPYQPQSKPVESSFNIIRQAFERYQVGWCGHTTDERPDKLALEIAEKRLMWVQELEERFERWAWSWEREYNDDRGEAPIDQWKNFQPEVLADERVLDVLMLKSESPKVKNGKIRIANADYIHPALYAYSASRVDAFWDPKNMGTVQVYSGAQYVCEAEFDTMMTMNPTEQEMKNLWRKKRMAKKQVRRMNEHWQVSNMEMADLMQGMYEHQPEEEPLPFLARAVVDADQPVVERVMAGDLITDTRPDGSVLQYTGDTSPMLLAGEVDPNARVVRRVPEVEQMIASREERRPEAGRGKPEELEIDWTDVFKRRGGDEKFNLDPDDML